MHHPPHCAGPKQRNDEALVRSMVPRFAHAGVRLVLAGHEHNFQHSAADGSDDVVSGAGGKLRPERPEGFVAAHTASWSDQPHLLVIDATTEHLTAWPVREVRGDGTLVCVDARTPTGALAPLPVLVDRAGS